MPVPCLIVATGTLWSGAARIPKALAHAGFDVALLAPKDSLAEKSRFVGRIGHLPPNASTAQWLFAFAAMVKAVAPRIIFPGDDMAFRLLQLLVTEPPAGMQPALHASLAALIRESLGDPEWTMTSVDKTLLPPAVASFGVEMAPAVAADLPAPPNTPMLAQKARDGTNMFYPVAAWKGELLAGWAFENVVSDPAPNGPSTVSRRYRDPIAREVARKLVGGFAMSGLLNFEFILNGETRHPVLIEVNRRIPPGMHSGAKIKVDLCAALLAAMEGRPSPTRADLDDGESGYNVHFPQEWLRDPHSEWLRKYPVDVPWDEPELFEALLALRHEK